MEPINYSAQIANPMAAAVKGLQLGDGMHQMDYERAVREQALQQQQAQQQALQGLYSNPNAGYQDYARVAMMMPKDQAESIRKSWDVLDKGQQQSELSYNMQVMSALKANPQVGIDLLNQRAEAAKNGGKMDQYQVYNAMAQAAQKDPLGVANHVGILTAAVPGAKDALEGFTKIGGEQRSTELHPAALAEGIAKANKEGSLATQESAKAAVSGELAKLGLDEKRWNIKNLQSEIGTRSARLNLDAQTTAATVAEKMASIKEKLTALPEHAQKLVNESAVEAATAKQSAARMNALANDISELGRSWGALNSLGEWSAKHYGSQDFRSSIQGEYTRLANSAGIKAYKAAGATGGFSDTDLKTALAGIPPSNANPAEMARFMRGMAKMQDIDAALNNAKTDWLTSNKGQLGRASSGFIAGDFAVKPGETYADFAARAAESVAKRYGSKQSSAASQIPGNTPGQIPGNTPGQIPENISPTGYDYNKALAIIGGK